MAMRGWAELRDDALASGEDDEDACAMPARTRHRDDVGAWPAERGPYVVWACLRGARLGLFCLAFHVANSSSRPSSETHSLE